ncbi:transposase [Streptomyces sp. NPDC059193]|uniref:transposase n=1 Tax=Streptomyces sp. NPDC059193 TaxID=3346763 RepID=UPI0036A29CD2
MPTEPFRGRRWADHPRKLEAIVWKYRTNSPRRDLPDDLGPVPDRPQTADQMDFRRNLAEHPVLRAGGRGRR